MSAEDFVEVYNRVAERYTGDLDRDLAEAGLPPLVLKVAQAAGAWAAGLGPWAAGSGPPPEVAGALGFNLGVQVGIEWERARRG